MYKFFDELYQRFKLPTPDFFKRMKALGAWLTGLSVILLGLHSNFPGMNIPDVVNDIAGYSAVAGFVLISVSQLTVADDAKPELDKKLTETNTRP